MVFYKIRDYVSMRRLGKIMDKWKKGEVLTDTNKRDFYFAKGIAVRKYTLDNFLWLIRTDGLLDRNIRKMEKALDTFADVCNSLKHMRL